MSQPLVLAIEPDLRQAAIVKRIVREKALAEIAVVDSRDAAIEAMRTCMPDVLLLSALMSPRDEDELIAHLKTLDNAGHLQPHTIPQLASALGPGEERASRGLLSAFRRKKEPAQVASGCDPDLFAEEIRVFLQRAADKKSQLQNTNFTAPDMRPSATASTRAAAEHADEASAPAGPSSAWSSPFEWKPSGGTARATRAPEAPPARAAQPSVTTTPPLEPTAPEATVPLSVLAEAPAPVPETPIVEAVPVALVPDVVVEPIHAVAPVIEPVHAVAQPVTAPEPVAAKPAAPKAAPEPARPKAVADRPRATRVPFQGLVKRQAAKDRESRDRLGPLARWARSETPRAAKTAPVTGDDVRALISSLAVPAAVASVTYPSGCRIRRVRVPVSPDHDGGASVGPVILSRQKLAEQRDKQASAQ